MTMTKPIDEFILTTIRNIKNESDTITKETPLRTLAFEEVDYSELAILCEEEYGLFLEEEIMESKESIGDIIHYVTEQIAMQTANVTTPPSL